MRCTRAETIRSLHADLRCEPRPSWLSDNLQDLGIRDSRAREDLNERLADFGSEPNVLRFYPVVTLLTRRASLTR
jgi:hypothetical protein